jgi:hypothetical protein
LLCGHRHPFSTWTWATEKLAVGVCQQCRRCAEARLTAVELEQNDHGAALLPVDPSASVTTEPLPKNKITVDDIYRVDRSAVERQLGHPIRTLSPEGKK